MSDGRVGNLLKCYSLQSIFFLILISDLIISSNSLMIHITPITIHVWEKLEFYFVLIKKYLSYIEFDEHKNLDLI
jgi:hypothetical protein